MLATKKTELKILDAPSSPKKGDLRIVKNEAAPKKPAPIKSIKTKSFSLGTKLLVSVVSLIVFSGVLLDFSTIMLLRQDKRTYTFQMQSSEAFLVGKNLVKSFQSTIDLLKLSLSFVNPTKTLSDQDKSSIQSVLDHQSQIVSTKIETFNPKSFEPISVLSQSFKDKDIENLNVSKDDLVIPYDLLKSKMPDLIKDGYLLLNVSKMGSPGILAVAVTDVNPIATSNDFIPVAMGFFPVESFGAGIKADRLTVASQDGHIVYDTDSPSFFLSKSTANDALFSIAQNNPSVPNGTKEFEVNGKTLLGSYFRPGLGLVVLTRTPFVKAMRATYLLTEKFILLGIIAIGSSLIFAILFSKSLTAPILKLYEATKEVAKGNFSLNLEINSKDEIGALAKSFTSMSKEISELIQERVRKVHLENELAIASTVQQTLIPAEKHETDRLSIYSHYRSATECGGDWWGFFEMGNKTCIMIADATGHGLPSALITAAARSCFSLIQMMAERNFNIPLTAAELLSYANRVIYDASHGKIMMTFFVGILDHENGSITFANAAHNPPFLFHKTAEGYSKESLSMPGVRLGENRDLSPESITEQTVPFGTDDVLFLYTDGILEGTNLNGDEFGKKKLRKITEAEVGNGPKSMIQKIMMEFMVHNSNKSLDDDVTLVAVKIKAKGGSNV